jgi:hypothetical protein
MGQSGQATEFTLQKLADLIFGDTLGVSDCHCLIAADKLTGVSRGGAIGSSESIGTGAFVILSNIAAAQPAAEMQMEVVSTSVNDAAAGSHAQEVTIVYMPEAWSTEFSEETLVLDGQTPVNTVATDIYRIEDFYVSKGQVADGTVTLKDTGAVATYAQIDQHTTFFQRCIHYIRTGYRSVVTDIIIGCQTNGGVTWRLFRSTKYGDNIVTRGRLSVEIADDAMNHAWKMPVVCANPNGDRMAIGLAVSGALANQKGGFMMNKNNKKNPEYLELDSSRNVAVVTMKQLERIEKVLAQIAITITIGFVGVIICIM